MSSVCERCTRLTLIALVTGSLFLPWHLSFEGSSTWIVFLVSLVEGVSHLFKSTSVSDWAYYLGILLFALTVPLLLLINACLVAFPARGLKLVYRILAPALVVLTWYESLQMGVEWRGVGFWTNLALVSAAPLVEIVLVTARVEAKLKPR
jgi:hypothetical protein